MISYIERIYFNDLLNRGGYVLDFSTYGFDEFTLHSVGIALCETYNLSKGKSLNEFINEGDNDKVVKLLDDLVGAHTNLFIISVRKLLKEKNNILRNFLKHQKS